jgi:hypothetical protein
MGLAFKELGFNSEGNQEWSSDCGDQNEKARITQQAARGRFTTGLIADEEVGGHGDAYCNYYPADVFLVHFLGVVGAGVAAG